MSMERAYAHLSKYGLQNRIRTFDVSSATVELAAAALGVDGARIVKTLSYLTPEGAILIAAAGDIRIDNRRFKEYFHTKAKMLTAAQAEEMIGHAVGGVCPFGVNEGVKVYLDESIKRFDKVYPAAGTANSAVELSVPELEQTSEAVGWVDLAKREEP